MKKAGVAAVMVDVLQLDRGAGPDDVPAVGELPADVLEKRTIEAGKAEELAGAWTRIGAVAAGFEARGDAGMEIPGRIAVAEQRLAHAGAGPLPRARSRGPGRTSRCDGWPRRPRCSGSRTAWRTRTAPSAGP